ncbi:MAG: sulfotransferase, partial [Caulobacterales bacterium]
LLASDPANGTTMTWEVMLPNPPPEKATYDSDPRRAVAHMRMNQWNRVAPNMAGMHDWSGYQPTENIHLQCMSFQSPVWMNILGQVPSYNAYMHGRSLVPAFEYEKRVLKYLQWRNPRKRWVLKTPVYLDMMPFVLAVYPDARTVWIHRDPIQALASAVAVAGTLNIIRSDRAYMGNEMTGFLGNLEAYASAEATSVTLNRMIEWLENGTVPKSQLCNVQYGDFIRSPLDVVRQIYSFYDIPEEPESFAAMERYLSEERKKPRERHAYERGDPANIARERAIYKPYQDYFQVPSEES